MNDRIIKRMIIPEDATHAHIQKRKKINCHKTANGVAEIFIWLTLRHFFAHNYIIYIYMNMRIASDECMQDASFFSKNQKNKMILLNIEVLDNCGAKNRTNAYQCLLWNFCAIFEILIMYICSDKALLCY